MPKKLAFDEEQLARVVATSVSFWMVARALRPESPRGVYKQAQRRIRELGLDTSHFNGRGPRRRSWTDEQLIEAAASSRSVRQTIGKLRLVGAGGNYDQVQRRIKELAIDTSHFTGQAWNKGGLFRPIKEQPLSEILVAGRWITSHHLKQRLIRAGLKKAQCELCGWCEHAPDERIPIELDHVNGDRFDNRLENLRILCPNCHSLQPTHRGLNKKSVRPKS